MENRTTPDLITELADGQVFVFGSNYAGRHGAGAAKTALRWGARYGTGEGLVGQTYALPTKGYNLREALSLNAISIHVEKFARVAWDSAQLTFLVTEVGCGLAGYRPYEVARLFAEMAQDFENVHLPASFWQALS